MARRHPVRGRIAHARVMLRGMSRSGGIFHSSKILIQDALESRRHYKGLKKQMGRKEYRAMRRQHKAETRYYRNKHYGY